MQNTNFANTNNNYFRPYFYKTPEGVFATLDQVALVYSITKEGARKRFLSKQRQDWIAYVK